MEQNGKQKSKWREPWAMVETKRGRSVAVPVRDLPKIQKARGRSMDAKQYEEQRKRVASKVMSELLADN